MRKLLAGLLVGAMLGSIGTYYFLPSAPRSQFSKVPDRDIQDVPEISVVEAEVHRRDRYASIKTIEDTLALPSDFAETEALYVIAGRANSDELQDLIYQAARIYERTDREAALQILLLRLTELDPRSALAITRTATFRGEGNYESAVWVAWGRLDLEAALAAAREGTAEQKKLAAQSLYASTRGQDGDKTELIRSALGVSPGRNARVQHLYALADNSPADAIRYIESLDSMTEQREQFGWLAFHLNRTGGGSQSKIAELIKSPANRKMFEQAMVNLESQSDPEAVLKKLLADPASGQNQNQAYGVLHQLAQVDPDKAFEYLEQMPDNANRQGMRAIVLAALAESDPQRALAWARENDPNGEQMLLAGIISKIAESDPQLALAEARAIESKTARNQAVAMIVNVMAQNNPSEAARILGTIVDPETRRSAVDQLGANWVQLDFEAAVAWASSLNEAEQRRALRSMGQNLVYSDLDRAISLLDRFPGSDASALAVQIAQNLAQQRSIDEAQAFIARYKGTDGYAKLQYSMLASAAASDPARAMQLAKSVENDQYRDQLYAAIVGQQAARDPLQALQWMESISNPSSRSQAMAQIAMQWYSQDPAAAEAWLHNLPRGSSRDDVIVATSMVQRSSGAETRRLIDSIDDEGKRNQAMLRQVQVLMHTDPAEAKRVLMELDISETERSQYMQMLENSQLDENGWFGLR